MRNMTKISITPAELSVVVFDMCNQVLLQQAYRSPGGPCFEMVQKGIGSMVTFSGQLCIKRLSVIKVTNTTSEPDLLSAVFQQLHIAISFFYGEYFSSYLRKRSCPI